MAAQQQPESTGTALATTQEKSAVAQRVDERVKQLRERNQMAAAIRGTQWGKECSRDAIMAVAHYCNENGLDPVRHVEILGGRIYLTAELYDEKGAHLIRAGVVVPDEPDIISADERLDKLAAAGDAWAQEEKTRRIRERIKHGVPEGARAAVVQRFRLASTGKPILGVNWVGGTTKKDPVGESEPTKTAITRARRRAWKQIADVVPAYAEAVRPLEASAKLISEAIPVAVVERHEPRALAPGQGYDTEPAANVGPRHEAERRTITGSPKGHDIAAQHANERDPYAEEPEFIDDRDIAEEEEEYRA